jgi:hypothetical protein
LAGSPPEDAGRASALRVPRSRMRSEMAGRLRAHQTSTPRASGSPLVPCRLLVDDSRREVGCCSELHSEPSRTRIRVGSECSMPGASSRSREPPARCSCARAERGHRAALRGRASGNHGPRAPSEPSAEAAETNSEPRLECRSGRVVGAWLMPCYRLLPLLPSSVKS